MNLYHTLLSTFANNENRTNFYVYYLQHNIKLIYSNLNNLFNISTQRGSNKRATEKC